MRSKVLAVFDVLKKERNEFIDRLVSFVPTDTVLFYAGNTGDEEKKQLEEVLVLANQLLETKFVCCQGISVSEQNVRQQDKVKAYLLQLPMVDAALVYVTATEVCSVLCGILFVAGKINAEEVFRLAFYEELCQQKKWGMLLETVQRQEKMCGMLKELERIRDERNLFEN